MSEIVPEPLSFESVFYEEAIRFGENLRNLDPDTFEEMEENVEALLRKLNGSCDYIGVGLEITSDQHTVDLSHAEVPGVELESAAGALKGTFIGFGLFPYENPETSECQPSLATIMDSSIEDDILEVDFPVIIITPIMGAEINLITS